jgi:hypothetical protein
VCSSDLYWLNNKLYDIESRNLGYFSPLQTQITYLLKANIIDYIQNNIIKNNDANDNFFTSTLNKFRKLSVNTDGKMELTILSILFNTNIIVYDNFSNVKIIYSNGKEYPPESIDKFETNKNNIAIKFYYDGSSIPKKIFSLYI